MSSVNPKKARYLNIMRIVLNLVNSAGYYTYLFTNGKTYIRLRVNNAIMLEDWFLSLKFLRVAGHIVRGSN